MGVADDHDRLLRCPLGDLLAAERVEAVGDSCDVVGAGVEVRPVRS
jgi:hypothetical protein